MSKAGKDVHPVRRRAGLLSALTKVHTAVFRLIDSGGSTDEAREIQQKLEDRYTTYLECHETALVEVPERETSLNTSHFDIDQRHQDIAEQLQVYIDDGIKTERSLHVRSLFSSKSSSAGTAKSVSNKHSSRRSSRSVVSQAKSDRLSEARVQAEIAKANVQQQRALQETQQKKLAAEREAVRQRIEFERQAAQEKIDMEREAARRQLELDEQTKEAARRQLELNEQKRLRDEEIKRKDIQRRLLQEETERQQRELEEELETQRQLAEYERRRAEVKIREREEMRSALGSDYESDDEREDVTREQVQVKKPTNFQPIEDQQASMLEILQEYSKPKINVDVSNMTQRKRVGMWLDESDGMMRKPLQAPHNTPAVPQITYRLPAETRKEPLQLLDSQERRDSMFNSPLRQTRDPAIQSNSDAALFSRVLRENRLP